MIQKYTDDDIEWIIHRMMLLKTMITAPTSKHVIDIIDDGIKALIYLDGIKKQVNNICTEST